MTMTTLEVLKMGHPKLREVCSSVEKNAIHSEKFQIFLDELTATMRASDGVGIAAPQVGVLQRVFVIEVDDNPRYLNKNSFELLIIINPEIKILPGPTVDSWEGCLSIPGIRGRLKRADRIELKGLDRNGKAYQKILTGFPAIVAQHELDHLNGILYIDRMTDLKSLSFE